MIVFHEILQKFIEVYNALYILYKEKAFYIRSEGFTESEQPWAVTIASSFGKIIAFKMKLKLKIQFI